MPIFRLFSKLAKKREKPTVSVRAFGLTHTGLIRKANQDAFLYTDIPSETPVILGVADGMGGHQGGEVAANQCIKLFGETLKEGFQDSWRWPSGWGEHPNTKEKPLESHILERALMTAHFLIRKLGQEDEDLRDMGTTFTGGLIEGDTLHYIHVGDSRLYLARDETLTQLTSDHRFDPAVGDTLLIPSELAEFYLAPNVLTQSVGGAVIRPEIGTKPLKPSDVLLICSDGQTDMISKEHIRRVLSDPQKNEKQKAQELIDAGLTQGGRDNITVVVAVCH